MSTTESIVAVIVAIGFISPIIALSVWIVIDAWRGQ